MSLAQVTVPVEVMLVMCSGAIGALLVMYRSGHNKTILGMMLADVWLFSSFLLYALGLIGEAERIALLRDGLFLLQFAIIIGAVVFVLKRRNRA